MKYWEGFIPIAKEIAWDELNDSSPEVSKRILTNKVHLSISNMNSNARLSQSDSWIYNIIIIITIIIYNKCVIK
jgi:hypothetical protein